MLLGIISGGFVLAGAVGIYFIVLTPHANDVLGLVSGSYETARTVDFSVSKDFDVSMCDTRLDDVFLVFPEDDAYMHTAQSIMEEVGKIRFDIANFNPNRRYMHYSYPQVWAA